MIRKAHIAVIVLAALSASYVQAYEPPLSDPLAAGWKGEKVCELLHQDSDQRILRCSFPRMRAGRARSIL
jgi:hypothetical protein